MTWRWRLLAVLALTATTTGCAVGKQLISPHGDYRLYRQTRLAKTLEQRLAAGNRYLHVAPNGPYAQEVKTWFGATERAYLARAHDQLPMLNAYLQAVPDGPSVAEVKARIEELETAAGFAQGRAAARDQRVQALEAGLERAAAQRKTFIADLTSVLGAVAVVRSYGQPLNALPPELLARVGVTDPAAGCPLDVCEKSFGPRFAIPHTQSQLVPREAPYALELTTSGGVVIGARLHGRELFSRIGEALDLRPVSFSDPQARAEAIGRALSLVGNALGAALAAEGCERPAVSPVVLERACDGLRVTVTAAIDAGNDDVIAFGPIPPAAPVRSPRPVPKRSKP
jgi:hypothetical protein